MPQAKLSLTVRKARPRASIIDIKGEFTGAAENVLMDAYTQASAGNARAIIMNFAGMEYMNSSGIGLLITLLVRIERQKQYLLVYGLQEHYRQIFSLTRLDEAVSIYDSEADALAAANAL
jgi:anti-anti-sigma factor